MTPTTPDDGGYACPRCHAPLEWPDAETAYELPRDWADWAAFVVWLLVLGLVALASVAVVAYIVGELV